MGIFGNDRSGQPLGASDNVAVNNMSQTASNGGFIATPPANDDAAMQQSVNSLMNTQAPNNTPAPAVSDFIATPPAMPANPPVATETPPPEPPAQPDFTPVQPETAATPQQSGDLSGIKQQALQQLSPIVSHLDQSPEEKFHTTMMMLQATDDQNLVQTAYEIAQTITDDKARAQALLDIINEINYFTQQK